MAWRKHVLGKGIAIAKSPQAGMSFVYWRAKSSSRISVWLYLVTKAVGKSLCESAPAVGLCRHRSLARETWKALANWLNAHPKSDSAPFSGNSKKKKKKKKGMEFVLGISLRTQQQHLLLCLWRWSSQECTSGRQFWAHFCGRVNLVACFY